MNTQKEKDRVRHSKEWKELKETIRIKQNGRDCITGAKIRKSANLHHMNLDPEEYGNLSDESHFILVNSNTHKWIHQMLPYYKKDETVIDRLEEILKKMKEINSN